MSTSTVLARIEAQIEAQIEALQNDIDANHGKRGNAERRKALEALYAKRIRVFNYHYDAQNKINGQNREGRNEYHYARTLETIAKLSAYVVTRGGYGEIVVPDLPSRLMNHPQLKSAARICKAAAVMNRAIAEADGLSENMADFDRKGRGTAINHSLYAVSADDEIVLVQEREYTANKYGGSVKIDYFVTNGDIAVRVPDNVKALIKRAAAADPSADSPLRAIAKHLPADFAAHIGGEPVKFSAPMTQETTVYKIVARVDGELQSVYDPKMVYTVGTYKTDKAKTGHRGGLYCYGTEAEALAAQRANAVFNTTWLRGRELVMCRCTARGGYIKYASNKRAYSMLRIDEVVSVVA